MRCSMLKEMPELRAPEKRRTGMEMRPKVKCPDQTDDGIVPSQVFSAISNGYSPKFMAKPNKQREFSVQRTFDASNAGHGESKFVAEGVVVSASRAPAVVLTP